MNFFSSLIHHLIILQLKRIIVRAVDLLLGK